MAESKERGADRPLSAAVRESLELVKNQLDSLAFGSILLTIHDGKVVQMELTEKRRIR